MVCVIGPDTIIASEDYIEVRIEGNPPCNAKDNMHAGLLVIEDMKVEDCTRVRVGLFLAWKASLATDYEDSFLCNRLYVTLDSPPGVYINRRV